MSDGPAAPTNARRGKLDDETKKRLVAAIQAVESRSGAELVLVVRPQSDAYLHASTWAGVVAGVVALVFLLYSPFDFALHWFVVDPLVTGIAVALAVHFLPPARRALVPVGWRRRSVGRAAQATFFDHGVRMTKARIGILIYLSILEREGEILADKGVLDAVDERVFNRATRALLDAFTAGADWPVIAERIEALGDVLGPAIPRGEDDENELPDEVHHG